METDNKQIHVTSGGTHRRHAPPLYGVIAEFENPSDLVAAARRVYSLGYRRINGYSPYPIEELSEAIGFTTDQFAVDCFYWWSAWRHRWVFDAVLH